MSPTQQMEASAPPPPPPPPSPPPTQQMEASAPPPPPPQILVSAPPLKNVISSFDEQDKLFSKKDLEWVKDSFCIYSGGQTGY